MFLYGTRVFQDAWCCGEQTELQHLFFLISFPVGRKLEVMETVRIERYFMPEIWAHDLAYLFIENTCVSQHFLVSR